MRTKLKIQIGGMRCRDCTRAVETSLGRLPGVHRCNVQLGEATVTFDESVIPRDGLFAAIREAGSYDITGFWVLE